MNMESSIQPMDPTKSEDTTDLNKLNAVASGIVTTDGVQPFDINSMFANNK